MMRTTMAQLPCLIQTRFGVPGKFSDSSRKQRNCLLEIYVVRTHQNRHMETILMSSLNMYLFSRRQKDIL